MYSASLINLAAGILNLVLYYKKPNAVSLICAGVSLSLAIIFLPF